MSQFLSWPKSTWPIKGRPFPFVTAFAAATLIAIWGRATLDYASASASKSASQLPWWFPKHPDDSLQSLLWITVFFAICVGFGTIEIWIVG
jgi:hypothetical protein